MKYQDNLNIASTKTTYTVGFYSSIVLVLVTIVTFGLALTAIPISGTYAPGGGIAYPYLDTLQQFPKDYLWMFAAMIIILTYMVYMLSINSIADQSRKIFGQISITFAIIASVVLLADYYIQVAVIPVSLINNETEGLALVTQYNPRGIFIVLEELGYIMMTLSFLFISRIFNKKSRLDSSIRWIFTIAFVLSMLLLVIISIQYGIDRKDRFEIASLSISWLVLIINGILVSIYFKRKLKSLNNI